jgi:hypothetical protein
MDKSNKLLIFGIEEILQERRCEIRASQEKLKTLETLNQVSDLNVSEIVSVRRVGPGRMRWMNNRPLEIKLKSRILRDEIVAKARQKGLLYITAVPTINMKQETLPIPFELKNQDLYHSAITMENENKEKIKARLTKQIAMGKVNNNEKVEANKTAVPTYCELTNQLIYHRAIRMDVPGKRKMRKMLQLQRRVKQEAMDEDNANFINDGLSIADQINEEPIQLKDNRSMVKKEAIKQEVVDDANDCRYVQVEQPYIKSENQANKLLIFGIEESKNDDKLKTLETLNQVGDFKDSDIVSFRRVGPNMPLKVMHFNPHKRIIYPKPLEIQVNSRIQCDEIVAKAREKGLLFITSVPTPCELKKQEINHKEKKKNTMKIQQWVKQEARDEDNANNIMPKVDNDAKKAKNLRKKANKKAKMAKKLEKKKDNQVMIVKKEKINPEYSNLPMIPDMSRQPNIKMVNVQVKSEPADI